MAGYSSTPLVKKLGLKEGSRIVLVNQPDNYFSLLDDLPDVKLANDDEQADFLHFFTRDVGELKEQLPLLKSRMKKDAMLWISWPKKASKVPTTIDENLVRSIGVNIGLVDVKICAVDEVWSGLKFMYRIKDR
ncbi:DUF3052 domain-containing protein [Fulvivirga sp. 29W222]|uniref:DUF3052 domain-containing protein n=1 Tax=Fulvivirga marina TaxID=2494733 RepID=A0A937FUY8_9BACT|nr:DUF3052 domain-containing protein [Fulvivirga marina]MBL6444908.1 DUF3052 domain-containing protein [Fulvivirga marina]